MTQIDIDKYIDLNRKMKIARIYMRVSTDQQSLERQEHLVDDARKAGYYVAGVYKEKASGANAERAELMRLINDLQPDDVIIAEKLDRISRLPLPDAEKLMQKIKEKGARISVPDLIDFSDIIKSSDGVARIVLDAMQELLLKIALQNARDDYETRRRRQSEGIAIAKAAGKYKGRPADQKRLEAIRKLRKQDLSYQQIAEITGCSLNTVWRALTENKSKK